MPDTVSDVITWARRGFPALDRDAAERFANRVNRDLHMAVPVNLIYRYVSLTSGTSNYALDAKDLRVWKVIYEASATSRWALEATRFDNMDADDPLWEYLENSTPSQWMIYPDSGTLKICLSPTPSTSTSGTYPRLKYRVSQVPADLDDGTSTALPTAIFTSDAYVNGIRYFYALEERRSDLATLEAAYLKSKGENIAYFNQLAGPDARPSFELNSSYDDSVI